MNPEPNGGELPRSTPDDEQLGALVRSVADEWRMPPQRLDLPTWRERVRAGATGRRSWLPRFAVPAVAALLATVVLAVAAVWLTAPRGNLGTVGASPSPSAEPSTSIGPEITPLPRVVRSGDLPSVTRVLVRSGGHYRVADLATGTLGVDSISSFSAASQTTLVARSSGGWLCLCVQWAAVDANGPTGLSLSLASIDADGNADQPREVRRVDGARDPNVRSDLQFQVVDANVSVTPDGQTAFFAWTVRNGSDGWSSGVDVIDVAAGQVVGSSPVPAGQPSGTQGQPVSRNAPAIRVSPLGDRVLISSFWYVEDPNNPNPTSGTEHWTAPFDGQAPGQIATLPFTSSADCGEDDSGLIDSGSYYLVCAGQTSGLAVRRVGLDGASIGETPIPRTQEEFSAGSLVARSSEGLYVWDPVAAVLSRVDLGTGALSASQAPGTGDAGSPLDALAAVGRRVGRWIAPSVVAKLLLEPGLVVSPDGTRVYAIGVTSSSANERGSTGVFAFDAASLAPLGNWAPTADFTSIAVSADGRFVYAAAQGGVDANGHSFPNGSSVTIFDATDGSVRLIAGRLGLSDLWFAGPTLR